MSQQIVFNGKTYNSVEEMPEKERKAYLAITQAFADSNGNGIPDLLEGADVSVGPARIFFKGRLVKSLDELSPQEQAEYQRAMARLDTDGNGIPDVVEKVFGMQEPSSTAEPATWQSTLVSREPEFPTSTPVIGEMPDADSNALKGRAILFILMALLILGAALFFIFLAR